MSMTIPSITITAQGDEILLSGNTEYNKPISSFIDKPTWSLFSNPDAIQTYVNGRSYEISRKGLTKGLEKFVSKAFAQAIVSKLHDANQDTINKAIEAATQMQIPTDALTAIESPVIANTDKIRKAFEIFIELTKMNLGDAGAAQGILDEIVKKLGSILSLTKIQLKQAYSTTLIHKDTILMCKALEMAYSQTALLLKTNPKILRLKDKIVKIYKNLPFEEETAQHSIGKKIIEYSLTIKISEFENRLKKYLQEEIDLSCNITEKTDKEDPLFKKYDIALLNLRIYQRKLDQINRNFIHLLYKEIEAWMYFNKGKDNFHHLLIMVSEKLKKIEFVKKLHLFTQLIFCDFSESIFIEEYQNWYKNEIEFLIKEFDSALDEYHENMNWRALSDIVFLIDENIEMKNANWKAIKEDMSPTIKRNENNHEIEEDPFYKACKSAIEKIKTFIKEAQSRLDYNFEMFNQIKFLIKENKNFKDHDVYISTELEERKNLIKKIACHASAFGAVRRKAIKGVRRVMDKSLIPSIGFRTSHTVLLLPEEKIVVKEPNQRALAEERLIQQLFSFFSHLVDRSNLVLSAGLREDSLNKLQVNPSLEYGFKYARLKDTPALQRLFNTLSLEQQTLVEVLRNQKTYYEDLKEREFSINGKILKFEELYHSYHEGRFNDCTKLEDRSCTDDELNKKHTTISEYRIINNNFQLALDYNPKLDIDEICFIPNLPSRIALKEFQELNGEMIKLTQYDLKEIFLCHLNEKPILLREALGNLLYKNGRVIQKSVSDVLQGLNEKQKTTFGKFCALSWKLIFPILIEAKLKLEKVKGEKRNSVFERYVPLHGELLVKPFIQNMQIASDLIPEKAQKMDERFDILLDMLSDSSIMCVLLFLLLGAKDLHLLNIGLALKANASFKQFKKFSFNISNNFPFSIERNINKISLGKLIFLYLFGEIKADAEITIISGENDREKKVKLPLNQLYLLKKETSVEIIKLKAGISPARGEGINEELKKKLDLSKNELFSLMDAIEVIAVFFDTDRIFSFGNDFCRLRNTTHIPFRHAYLSSQKFMHKKLSEVIIVNLKNRKNYEPALDWLRKSGAFKQEKLSSETKQKFDKIFEGLSKTNECSLSSLKEDSYATYQTSLNKIVEMMTISTNEDEDLKSLWKQIEEELKKDLTSNSETVLNRKKHVIKKIAPRMSLEQLAAFDERLNRLFYYLDTYESLSKAVNVEKLKEFVEKSNVLDMERMEYYLEALKNAVTDHVKLSQIHSELLEECYPTFFNVAKAIYHKLANVVSLTYWVYIKNGTKKRVEKEKNRLGEQIGYLSMNHLLQAALAMKFDPSTVQWRVTEQLRKDIESPPNPWPPL